jgi:hypothetical protein
MQRGSMKHDMMKRDVMGRDVKERDVKPLGGKQGTRNERRATSHVFLLAAMAALAGCGVETATTAATGAAIKQQEVDQGKKTMEQAKQKAEQAAQQVQSRAEQTGAAADK